LRIRTNHEEGVLGRRRVQGGHEHERGQR